MAVFFDEATKYDLPLIQASIRRGLDTLEMNLRGKRSAFIKVNIVRPAGPNSGVVTHPVVVEALILVLKASGFDKITIGEGPAVGVNVNTAFRKSGYQKLARKMNVRLLNLHAADRHKKKWDHGLIELPSELMETDFYINVAKMKTHLHTGVTLSVKNQQGLPTPVAKKSNHSAYGLHQALTSLANAIQPDFIIVDAIDAMEGEGPIKGSKKHTHVLVYGTDMFETDIACCHFMKVPPAQVMHLNHAIKKGFASAKPEIKGTAFARHQVPFEMPSSKPKQIFNFFSWKNHRACAADEHSFEEAIRLAVLHPKYWFTFFPKFLYFVVFKRFDLLRGKKAKIPQDAGRTLCIGDCCKETAIKNNTYHVPGCPPKPEDILETISRMK